MINQVVCINKHFEVLDTTILTMTNSIQFQNYKIKIMCYYFLRYGRVVETPNWKLSLFDFLYKEIESYNVDTESDDESKDGEKCQTENSKPGKRKLTPGNWIYSKLSVEAQL